MNLDQLRKEIDATDAELVALLNKRTRVALEIGKLKEKQEAEVYVPAREKAVYDRIAKLNEGPLPEKAVQSIYREIMSASLALERNTRIAYLGPQATFTHRAAREKFGASVDYEACSTITDVFEAVQRQGANYGVVPIENSTEGAVTHTLDQFITTPLKICAEIYLPISISIMSISPLKDIKKIYSKPEVFGQCRHWLQANMPHADLIPCSSTARAAEYVKDEPGSAAFASPLAAELYDLNILAPDVQDIAGNTTRFLVIGRKYGPPSGRDKTSILIAVKHEAGSLFRAISVFNSYNLNMTKIESRPSRNKAWEYYFFVDFEGHVDESNVREAMTALKKQCIELSVLGSYPQAGRES
ncbi:MAG: prephenate dehydratase [Kiritimatiellia bacterium]